MRRPSRLRLPLLWLLLLLIAFPVSASAGDGKPYGKSAPTLDAPPSLNGSAVLGSTLTGNPGTWSGPSISYAFQWVRCDSAGNACNAIPGASAATYAIAAADVGATLRFSVTATNKNGSATASSNPTAVVAPPPAPPPSPPQNTALPQISGVAQDGQTLTASTGTWTGTALSYAYQWKRCDTAGANCASISGATSAGYGLVSADVGSTVRVTVSATNAAGTVAATSAATATVAARSTTTPPPPPPPSPPANTALPVVTGTAQVGQTLTVSTGSWSGSPTSYAYQWRRCDSAGANCTGVTGATASTYTLVTGDAGATFRAAVTATNAGGSATAVSAATAVVSSAPPAPAPSTGRFGIAAGGAIHNWSATDLARYMDMVKASRASWVRIDINWHRVQYAGPTSYNWTPFDNLVNAARSRGLNVLATILYTPPWARPAGTSSEWGPTNLNDYANFARIAAQRYGPLGVRAYEIWNEPNISAFWAPGPEPARYTQMLKLAYTAIKQADPSATVISAGLSPYGSYGQSDAQHMNPLNFLQAMYANGAATALDAVGWHPYNFPYGLGFFGWSAWSQMTETSPSARSIMTAYGHSAKQIWATEFGWPTGTSTRSVTEAAQAQLVTDSFAKLKAWSWAGPAFLYSGRDAGTNLLDIENNFGIVRFDWSPKPAFTAFQSAVG